MAFRFSLVPKEVHVLTLYMQTTAEIKAAAVHLKEMLSVDPPGDVVVLGFLATD